MANTYITKTPSSTTNQKTWTVSCWVKRAKLGSRQMIWGVNGDTSGNYFTQLEFNASDQLSPAPFFLIIRKAGLNPV